jgi:hypothetical protein
MTARIPGRKYWTVPREFPGKTIYLLGGGPSLAGFDLEALRGRPTIAINRTFELAPWADILYFCDARFWRVFGVDVMDVFTGMYAVTLSHVVGPVDFVRHLRSSGKIGLETKPDALRHGNNSGYQAINLAYLLGAKTIVLLGYDMKVAGTRTHAHEGYREPNMDQPTYAHCVAHSLKNRFLPHFKALVDPLAHAGVKVYNANPDSALDCFEKIPPAAALDL